MLTLTYKQTELVKKMYANTEYRLDGINIDEQVVKDLAHLESFSLVIVKRGG